MAHLVISLFGSFQVQLDGQPVIRFESDKVRALLAYLVVEAHPAGARHGARPHRREHLAGLLWPDLAESAARHNLSQSLFRLRQAIGDRQAKPPFLLITPQTIQFNAASDCWLDVAAFRAVRPSSATVDELAQAAAYYTGDFLAQFYGVGSDLFEEWAISQRESLRRHALLMLARLVDLYEEQRAYEAALQYARRQLELDALREETHRHLMRLLALSGQRSEAFAQYLACERILADELGVEPAPETTALYIAIRNAAPPFQSGLRIAAPDRVQRADGKREQAAQPTKTPWPLRIDHGEMPEAAHFYGRTAEQGELIRWLTTERCRLIALLGMGGVGKTSLAAKVVTVVAGDFEYVIWRSLLNAPPLAEILAEWLDLFSDEPEQERPDSLDRQVRLLLKQLRGRRCLLILDNTESIMLAGDRAGRFRLGYEAYGQLLRRVGESAHQSCLLLTSREKPQEFSHLERGEGPVRSQQLAGLSTTAGREMLEEEGIHGSAAEISSLLQRYSGNPLALRLIAETIRELFAGDIQHFLRQDQPLFADMEAVLDQQFARLSGLEVEIMTWLAIEREAVEPQTLRENLMRPPSPVELLAAFHSLVRRSLIEQRGAEFTLQNVIMEYTTTRLINQVCQALTTVAADASEPTQLAAGIVNGAFNRYPLLKAQAEEYIRQSQRRLLLQAVAEYLVAQWGLAQLESNLQRLLNVLQQVGRHKPGYAGGNLLNLLLQLGIDCHGYDFSALCIWQADLQGKTLPAVDFSHCDLRSASFTQTLGAITALILSSNGQLIAAATDDKLVWLWRTSTVRPVAVLAGHADFVTALAFSADGALLASASGDRTVCLWDVRQASDRSRPMRVFSGYTYDVLGLAFDPTGEFLMTVSVDCVRAWRVQSGAEHFCINELIGRGEAVAWSPDGHWLAIGIGEVIEVWAAPATLAGRRPHVRQRLHGHRQQIRRLTFSADSQMLVSASEDESVRIWRVTDGAAMQTLAGHTGGVRGVAIDPSSALVASSGADHNIHLWLTKTGERVKTLHGHTQTVMAVAFTPTGQKLVSGGADQTVRFWNVQSGHRLRTIQGHTRLIHSVAFSPHGDCYACAVQDGSAHIWDADHHRERWVLHGHQGLLWRVAFSPNGKWLASGGYDGVTCIWSVKTGELMSKLPPHTKQLSSLAFSPDGSLLASSGYGGTLRLWDLRTSTLLDAWPHPKRLGSLAFHPSGDLLAASCYDTLIYLWDVRRRQIVHKLAGHRYEAWGLDFNPDGSLLASGSDDQTVRLWEPATGVCRQVLYGHTGTVQSLAFHPKGTILASASQDRTIRLWNIGDATMATTDPSLILEGHRDRVTAIAFHPDGRFLLSSSADETMRLWDVPSGACLKTIAIPGPYDGMKIAGASGLLPVQIASLRALGAVD